MKKVFVLGIIFILLFTIRNLIASILTLSSSGSTVGGLNQQLGEQKQKHEFLKQELTYVESNAYVEEQARDKLGLAKPGDYMVLSPRQEKKNSPLPQSSLPNWQKWWNLFF